jgi:TRAP-type C4-dicarboxylate transport system permease small subunit
MKLLKWLDASFEDIILLIMLILITGAMSLQIVMRYIFISPLAWAEEFCRYCYIVSVFLSLAFTLKKGNMLRVNVVVDLFPTRLRNILGLFADILMLGAFVLFFRESVIRTLFVRTTGQVSPAMQIPTWLMYCVMILGFGLATIRSVQVIIKDLRTLGDRAITTKEAVLLEAAEEAAAVLVDDDHKKEGGK